MPIKSYKLKGTLTFGSTPLDVSCQVTAITVEATENVTTDEAIHVLCGDVLPASDVVDYTYSLTATMLQDLSVGGIVDYTWNVAGPGAEVPFAFTPDDTEDAVLTGVVRIIPLTVGGEVPGRPTSDLTWACVGTPDFDPGVAA